VAYLKIKVKTEQFLYMPEVSRNLRLPGFKTIGTGSKVVSCKHRLLLLSREYA
jgi:hypothetical protein